MRTSWCEGILRSVPLLAMLVLIFLRIDAAGEEMSQDKFGHFQTFYGIGAAVSSMDELSWQEKTALCLAPGVMKEILDSTEPGNRFDMWDLAYDALGMLTAFISRDDMLVMISDRKTIVLTIRF